MQRRLAWAALFAITTSLASAATAATPGLFTNSLGQRFVDVAGAQVKFCIWETRVGDFRAFVAATGHDATAGMYTLGADDHDWLPRGHTWKDPGFAQSDTHPVVGVNLADARAFCAWITAIERKTGLIRADQIYRLPTDREWSAAMGMPEEAGTTPEERLANADAVYPWGRDWPPPPGFGNYAGTESAAGKPTWWGTIPGGYEDAFPRTSPVGSFPPNAAGLYDLSGNVWEWVDEAYTASSIARVIRGGCWGSDRPAYLLCGKRNPMFVGSRNDETGFRIVLASSSAAATSASATAPTKVLVQLDWIKNAQFAGVLLAEAHGWYRDAGLDVTVRAFDSTEGDAIKPVVAWSGLAVGVADGSALLRARAAGAPIKAFATMFQASPLGIVTLKSSGLGTIASLRGKRIGLHAYDRPQLELMLRHSGLTSADVTVIEIGDDVHSLPTGAIDAQMCYVIDEAVALETAGHAVNTMFGYDHGYRAYSQVYFTTETTLASSRGTLRKFLEISNRGWVAALANPEATARLIIERHQPKLTVAYQAGSLALMEKIIGAETGLGGISQMRRETWEATPDATPALVDALLDWMMQTP